MPHRRSRATLATIQDIHKAAQYLSQTLDRRSSITLAIIQGTTPVIQHASQTLSCYTGYHSRDLQGRARHLIVLWLQCGAFQQLMYRLITCLTDALMLHWLPFAHPSPAIRRLNTDTQTQTHTDSMSTDIHRHTQTYADTDRQHVHRQTQTDTDSHRRSRAKLATFAHHSLAAHHGVPRTP